MKRKFIFASAIAVGICITPVIVNAETEILKDSGIDYTETVSTINNPGAGYTSAVWYECRPGDTPVKNPNGNLVVLFVDIGAFSGSINGEKDYDLDESFFTGIRGTLENCRNNGSTVGMRFRYDAIGKSNPEPETFEKILDHIHQIADDGFLNDYEDIIMYVESGFVGAWGEQHSGKFTSVEYKAKLLDELLKIVPESISVTVRTPNIICEWAGIETGEIAGYITESGSDAARIGLYNDGYMGSDSDLGTYNNPSRRESVEFMKKQMTHAYYGGEFSGNIELAQQYDTYLPENSIAEMYDTHLSYINSNIWDLYKEHIYTADLNVQNCDNSAYYGETVYRFMRDHIGYRFVLRDSDLTSETKQGGDVTVNFRIENTGFANPIKFQNSEVILEKDGKYMICDTDIDDREWFSTETVSEVLNLKLPSDIETGDWNIYLKLTAGNTDAEDTKRTVQFANNNIYNSSLGANYLGTVTVKEDLHAANQNFYEVGNKVSNGIIYDYNGRIFIDGFIGEREWQDKDLIAESNESKVYMKSDSDYLYVCAEVPDTSKAPVYNLQWKSKTAENQMWIYYASNGFVYFSGDDYSGVTCRFNGGIAEWKIPIDETMNLEQNDELDFIRVFVQDSANEWKVIDDLKVNDIKLSAEIYGDINSDGDFNTKDVIILMQWLLGVPATEIKNYKGADLYEDGKIDIIDLCVMKNKLLFY